MGLWKYIWRMIKNMKEYGIIFGNGLTFIIFTRFYQRKEFKFYKLNVNGYRYGKGGQKWDEEGEKKD